MNKREFDKNIQYLEDNDIRFCGNAYNDKFSAELETYTDAGEDMIITLEVLSKECLQKYINDFDINENVMLWWGDGEDAAHERGVPFTDIKDHYEDYENYIENLQKICDEMPY